MLYYYKHVRTTLGRAQYSNGNKLRTFLFEYQLQLYYLMCTRDTNTREMALLR